MLSPEINSYLDSLCENVSGIKSIWLIGSRANNAEQEESDWDFFIFGDDTIFNEINNNKNFKYENVDLLIVASDYSFKGPYGSNKQGDLNTWHWNETSEGIAEYISSNEPECDSESDGTLANTNLKAFRVKGISCKRHITRTKDLNV